MSLDSTALAHAVIDLIGDKQAEQIVLLDLRSLSLMADYFVICTATTERQTKAILDALTEDMKGRGIRPLAAEGDTGSGWVLQDYGSVIVHVFAPEQRAFYQLEQLWRDAPVVLKMM
ncbi:MAG: ribosome silencing factor [Anaerolineae bacterium]|nr:ribosome silencing factor [Anaerolineae bacterium]